MCRRRARPAGDRRRYRLAAEDDRQRPAGQTPWDCALGALGVSVLIGLAAGVVPAMRAARLNPVEALRAE
jgi:hypothetical protein